MTGIEVIYDMKTDHRHASSRDQIPPIVRHRIEAGIEVAEGYLERAEMAYTDAERQQFHELAKYQMRVVKNTV